MRNLVLASGLAILVSVLFVSPAGAGLKGPNPYSGRAENHCNAPTHLSYYDPRNTGQTIYDLGENNGDSMYYADDYAFAGFDDDLDPSYSSAQNEDEDCRGTPVFQATGFFAVTVGEIHVGVPECPRPPGNDRNPNCQDTEDGVQGGFFVGTPDNSQGVGRTGGVTVP